MAAEDGEVTGEDGGASGRPTDDPAPASLDLKDDRAPADDEPGDLDRDEGDGPSDRSQQSARAAAIVFGAFIVIAFPILLRIGDQYWFHSDDWGLLAGRSLDLGDLFRPQNRHWSTVPILSYRALYRVFGLHSYVPYMSVVITLHLTLSVLVRVVMRRAGVGPWVATIVAGTYVLFGAGNENYFLSIQVSMVGSMVCGFAHLILADHDGGFDRRDAMGLGFGLVGLMSSGIAPPLVMVVGLAVLLRRGWRMALVHTVPLGAIYGMWYLLNRDQMKAASGVLSSTTPPIEQVLDWIWVGLSGVFVTLGDFRVVAVALAVLLVVGLYLGWKPLPWAELRRQASMPTALLVGAVVLFVLVSSQRWLLGSAQARSPRYLDMATALVLPALAVAANAFVKRWKVAGSLVLVLFLIGVPANLQSFDQRAWKPGIFDAERDFVLGVAHADLAREVSPDVYPNPHQFFTDALTVGFLIEGMERGRIPDQPELSRGARSDVINRLSMSQSSPVDGPLTTDFVCAVHEEPLGLQPEEGDQFGIRGPVQISVGEDDERTQPTSYGPMFSGDMITAEVPDLTVQVRAAPPATTFVWCTPP